MRAIVRVYDAEFHAFITPIILCSTSGEMRVTSVGTKDGDSGHLVIQ
jgi:hypothetical protein